MSTKQITNGKAFEYAIAKAYKNKFEEMKVPVSICEDSSYHVVKTCYETFDTIKKRSFDQAAEATINTLLKIESGFLSFKNEKDVLKIRIAKDSEGMQGDVRDVIFEREYSKWEIGFSAKNNNDAVKHSRLSPRLDFGEKWLGHSCSKQYWEEIKPIFDYISDILKANPHTTWKDIENEKEAKIYRPILCAFRNEVLRINSLHKEIPAKLISYLIGEYPFYKIIKDDANNLVIVKAFNINGELNKTVNGKKSVYKTPVIKLPKRIIEFEFIENYNNTLGLILDNGWEVSFRIHNASSKLEQSLKFDVRLLGNPPVLFSQYIFPE